jgi:tetratricopeptide (TPR) repeat protein
MLDAHPLVYGMGEDSYFNSGLSSFRDKLVAAMSSFDLTETQQVLKAYAAEVEGKMVNQSLNDPSRKRMAPAKRVVDKMLFNYRNIGFIRLLFPNAVILHTVRDPMDTIFSCYRHKFDDVGLDWSLDADRLVTQYVVYLKVIDHFKKILPGWIHEISYEQLVSDPEKVMKGVIKRVGLKWDENVLKFYATNRTVHTHSMSQVRHGVSRNAIGVWRNYDKGLQPIMERLRPELRKLRSKNALPFADTMNWNLDASFDYGAPTGGESGELKDKHGNAKADAESEQYRKSKTKRESRKTTSKSEGKKSVRGKIKSKKQKNSRVNEKKRKSAKTTKFPNADKTNKKLSKLLLKWEASYNKEVFSSRYPLESIRTSLPISSGNKVIDKFQCIGYGYVLAKQYDVASEIFEAVIESAVSSTNLNGIFFGLAQASIYQGRIEESIIYLDKIIKLIPTFSEAYVIKSQALTMVNRLDESVGVLSRGLEFDKRNSQLLMQRGATYFRLKMYIEARNDFASIERTAQNEAELLALIGKCEKEFGDTESAEETLKKSLKMDPSRSDAYLDLGKGIIGAKIF